MVNPLLILGASTRAAAFSALRAGMQPWCADLFADADLRARCAVVRLPADVYPEGFSKVVDRDLPGPWMYTGALENWPWLIDTMTGERPLWGNDQRTLVPTRTPSFVTSLLHQAGIPCPLVRVHGDEVPGEGDWLVKPLRGAGGSGIHFWDGSPPAHELVYFQEHVAGRPGAALYVGNGSSAAFLGATHQLVGEPWLHAKPFRYCGSLGPLPPEPALRQTLQRIGNVLTAGCHLRGLFGIDFVLRDGIPWLVEVNPRYTASVEVLEYATGLPALALHRRVFDRDAPDPPVPEPAPGRCAGKAILFARETLTFPDDGPWLPVLRAPGPIEEMPAFADIPDPGQRIKAGRPILTFFARGTSLADCRGSLQEIAADLDRRLFGR